MVREFSIWSRVNARNVSFKFDLQYQLVCYQILLFHLPTDTATQFLSKLNPSFEKIEMNARTQQKSNVR